MHIPPRRAIAIGELASYAVSFAFIMLTPSLVTAQARCVDTTGDQCLGVIERGTVDGVVRDIFQTSDGRYAPELTFARLVGGVNGCIGITDNPTILEGYRCSPIGSVSAELGGNDPSFQANSLDWFWTQVLRTDDSGRALADGAAGFYYPWRGRIYDLGGEANRVALFPITDHVPLPCEAFEYSVWLRNDPNATEIAPEDAPDPRKWNPARLMRAFTEGWTMNPNALGAAEAGRADLGTHLRTVPAEGPAVADALTTVWALPCGLSFRYVSIQAGNYGNPGPECVYHSSDDELDAVAGLNEDDTAICIDADGDGHRDAACGGSDCDDTDPSVHPGAFEACDATEDKDCQPPRACPMGTTCNADTGLCATSCFEGGCASGFTCTSTGLCVDTACHTRTEPCPGGTLCREGACVAPCDGVVCPHGRVCVGGACIDPCLGVMCPTNQVCVAADPDALTVCGPGCTCSEVSSLCTDGTRCEAREDHRDFGMCVDRGCERANCAPSEVCAAGECHDACDGVRCPTNQVCSAGECVPDLCAGIACVSPMVCFEGTCREPCFNVSCPEGDVCWDGACIPDLCYGVTCGADERCVDGSCFPANPPPDAGMTADAGSIDAGPRGGGGPTGGCGCRVASPAPTGSMAWLAALALAFVWRRRTGRRGGVR